MLFNPKHRPAGWTNDDERAMISEFTVGGSCACDGAFDDGCPNCDEGHRIRFKAQRDAQKFNQKQ